MKRLLAITALALILLVVSAAPALAWGFSFSIPDDADVSGGGSFEDGTLEGEIFLPGDSDAPMEYIGGSLTCPWW
jgi:hypothetical protein